MEPFKFKARRISCKKTQKEISELLCVNQSQISRWERGFQPIPLWVEKYMGCLDEVKEMSKSVRKSQ